MPEGYVQCPKKDGDGPSLIVHVIPKSLCVKRQKEGFHKCPRCLNRTLPVDAFVPLSPAHSV
jgi:hypothetical protein